MTNGRRPIGVVPGAILPKPEVNHTLPPPKVVAGKDNSSGTITNGALRAIVESDGWPGSSVFSPRHRPTIRFVDSARGELLCGEFYNNHGPPARSLTVHSRGSGALMKAELSFIAFDDEQIYGLGQHQHGQLNQKGMVLDLVEYNTQVPIPFLLSRRKSSGQLYGFLWNVPAMGRMELAANNRTRWVAEATYQVDYLVLTGASLYAILERYVEATGHPPAFPGWASGYWQCKLRYASQAELLNVTREMAQRALPYSVIVIDYMHWPKFGDWRFDPKYWANPKAMLDEVRAGGVETVVSVWPTIEPTSVNYRAFEANGWLAATETGGCDAARQAGLGVTKYDALNPLARAAHWEQLAANYHSLGVRGFWLDADEGGNGIGEDVPWPRVDAEYSVGSAMQVGNLFPRAHAQAVFEGMRAAGETAVLSLSRSAWAGSQRYGAAVWSGDTRSTWAQLRQQLAAGLNMQMSGIVWWTFDAGGFAGGQSESAEFRELLVRWMGVALFMPLMRMHGIRDCTAPHPGFTTCPNEPWSFGAQAYGALSAMIRARHAMRSYIEAELGKASMHGRPLNRPLFFDFADATSVAMGIEQFMCGDTIMVAPILEPNATQRSVWFPPGPRCWASYWEPKHTYAANASAIVKASLDSLPPAFRRCSK